jgi:CRISPR-associated endonuclease Cas1
MAATETVAQRAGVRKSTGNPPPKKNTKENSPTAIEPRHGIVTLFGYGIGVRVERGHLVLEDGVGIDRHYGRFPRVGHGIERLVIIGSDGNLSLSALRWLADQNVAFIMLERNGRVLAATGPVRSSDAKLRRAQALANESGAALEIVRALIYQKLDGQEKVARDGLRDSATADRIAELRGAVPSVETMSAVRALEAQGARDYWSAWQNVAITFPKKDWPRVPDHWRVFGTRRSPLTECPRSAVNPANAMLNYLYALLEAEARLAAAAMGLDPGLGFLHLDTATRDSLACDLMEPVRPQVDAFVLDWISREPIKREWLFEQRDGTCRLMVAPVTEFTAETLWASQAGDTRKPGPATRLTGRRIREAMGGPSPRRREQSVKPQSLCRTCGASIEPGGKYCRACSVGVAADNLAKISVAGREKTLGPRAQGFRADTQRRHAAAQKAWDPASHPSWLNEEAYWQKVQPLLVGISTSGIATALGVSWAYASNVRKGKSLPHPRHWLTLAELAGISPG